MRKIVTKIIVDLKDIVQHLSRDNKSVTRFNIVQNTIKYTHGTTTLLYDIANKKVQVGKDQEKAQSEKDSHSKNRGGKKPN